MATYLFKLYPIDRFFFGGRITFGKGESRNYFVRSEYFPQQTTLLGALRFLILKQSKLLDDNGKEKSDTSRIIGSSGFNHSPIDEDHDYGYIKKLSPIFILGPEQQHFFAQSREFAYKEIEDEVTDEVQIEQVPLELKKRPDRIAQNEEIWHFDNYQSKFEMPDLLVNASTGQMHLYDYSVENVNNPQNGFFIPYQQVGNKIPDPSSKRQDNEDGFYKQVAYKLLPGFGFGFYADISYTFTNLDTIIKLGSDESYFNLKINVISESIEDFFHQSPDNPAKPEFVAKNLFKNVNPIDKKIVFLSDAFVPEEIVLGQVFSSLEVLPFKYMETTTNRGPFPIHRAGIALDKSKKTFNLIKKGSVLYFKSSGKKNEALEKIRNVKSFHQIGYNYAI